MNKRRIVIVGFMGSGKTTVAGALAGRLRGNMIDLDSFISDRTGRTPAEIIEADGEEFFRGVETRTLLYLLENTGPEVIALGGGTWTTEANREMIARHDYLSVWLDAQFDLCWQRIAASDSIRPLAPTLTAARELYQQRRASYALARFKVEIGGAEDADRIAAKIQTQLEMS